MKALISSASLEIEASKAEEMGKVALSNNTYKHTDDMSDDIKATVIQIIIILNQTGIYFKLMNLPMLETAKF